MGEEFVGSDGETYQIALGQLYVLVGEAVTGRHWWLVGPMDVA